MGYMGTAARSAIARPYGARRMGVTGIRGKRHAEDRDPILSTDRYTPVTIGASQMKPTSRYLRPMKKDSHPNLCGILVWWA